MTIFRFEYSEILKHQWCNSSRTYVWIEYVDRQFEHVWRLESEGLFFWRLSAIQSYYYCLFCNFIFCEILKTRSRFLKIRSLGVETPTYQVTRLVIKTRIRICTNFVIKVFIENKTNFVIPITSDIMTTLENCQRKKFNWFLNNLD